LKSIETRLAKVTDQDSEEFWQLSDEKMWAEEHVSNMEMWKEDI